MRRGQIFGSFTQLDLLYELPKSRIPTISAKAFLPWSKLVSQPGFSTSLLVKIPMSCWEFVLLRAILRAGLPDSAETSFASQSYIYLEIPLTEFFCNLSVPFL